MTVFITNGESACRTCGQHGFSPSRSLPDALQINLRLFGSLILEAVGYKGHSTAFLFIYKIHTISNGVHYLDKVFCQFRIIVICITSMEVAHLLMECFLLLERILSEPPLELLTGILRERTMTIHSKEGVHQGFDRPETESEIDYWSHWGSYTSHQVCIGQDIVSKPWLMSSIFEPGILYDVTDPYI